MNIDVRRCSYIHFYIYIFIFLYFYFFVTSETELKQKWNALPYAAMFATRFAATFGAKFAGAWRRSRQRSRRRSRRRFVTSLPGLTRRSSHRRTRRPIARIWRSHLMLLKVKQTFSITLHCTQMLLLIINVFTIVIYFQYVSLLASEKCVFLKELFFNHPVKV